MLRAILLCWLAGFMFRMGIEVSYDNCISGKEFGIAIVSGFVGSVFIYGMVAIVQVIKKERDDKRSKAG